MSTTKRYWSEIMSHYDELEGFEPDGDIVKRICIDGYRGKDENKPGQVIAKVILTKQGDTGVIYINDIARHDKYAQEVIAYTLVNIKSFTDQEFKEKMLKSDSDTLADFIGRDFLVFDGDGKVTNMLDVKSEINAVYAQMPVEELEKFWLRMFG